MIIGKKLLLISLILFVCLFCIQNTFALAANSPSYSIGRFGTGMATADPSSATYSSMALTGLTGTTRNGENDLHTTNVGFFDNTTYHRTVSITSYAIYPEIAVQGSIIRLSVSALNAESTWAILTLPDSTEETISLTNNGDSYYTGNSIGVHTVTFYANSSSGNLASVIDTFEITSPAQEVDSPSGGGGGGSKIIEKCTYVWDCSSWSICLDGEQTRECENKGTCAGIEDKPIESRICEDALFDVIIEFAELTITEENTLKFNVDLLEQEGIEKIDVQIKYTIIDKDNNEIFSQIETRAVKGNLTYNKELEEVNLDNGEYSLRVDIVYGNLQRAFAVQKFEVKKDGVVTSQGPSNNLLVMSGGIIILLIIIIILLIIKKNKKTGKQKTHREYKNKIKRNLKKIRSRNFLVTLLGVGLFGILFMSGKGITGFVIGSDYGRTNIVLILVLILSTILIALPVFIYRKNILEKIKDKKMNKHSKNSIWGLIKRKVYTEQGDFVGNVDSVFLGENKIDSLKIKLNKKNEFKVKGIIIKYRNVKSAGHIIIVENKVLGTLENNKKYKNKPAVKKIRGDDKNEKEI